MVVLAGGKEAGGIEVKRLKVREENEMHHPAGEIFELEEGRGVGFRREELGEFQWCGVDILDIAG